MKAQVGLNSSSAVYLANSLSHHNIAHPHTNSFTKTKAVIHKPSWVKSPECIVLMYASAVLFQHPPTAERNDEDTNADTKKPIKCIIDYLKNT